MKMICPRCQTGLARRWAGKAVYQLCVTCKGIAITKYALGSLADPAALAEVWSQAMGESKPSEAKCPSCLKGMVYGYFADGTTPVELDACPRCQLLWFDRGEYEGMGLRERPPSRSYMQIPAAETVAAGGLPVAHPELPDSGYGAGTVLLALCGLPVEDVGPLARYPAVTRTLAAATVMASLWGFQHPHSMLKHFAFRFAGGPLAILFTALSSFFFHGGLWHLVSNMYFFWVFGDDVENELGHEAYLALVVLATLGGNFLYACSADAATVPAIGASGGIAGLIAYYVIRFPHRRFRIFFFFRVIALRAYVAGAIYFALEFFGAAAQLHGEHGSVSHLSHVGGALVGAAWAVAIQVKANARAAGSG